MTTTVLQAFSDSVAQFLGASVFPSLIDNLRQHKQVEVTLEEITGWLNLPMTRQAPMGMPQAGTLPMQVPAVPGLMAGAPVMAGTTRAPRGKKVATDCPGCTYIYVKGAQEGDLCNKPGEQTPLGPRCRTHLGKQGKTEKTDKPAKPTGGAPPIFAGLTGMPAAAPAAAPQEHQLTVVRMPGTDFLLEQTMRAVLRQLPDGSVQAVGIQEGDRMRAPNEQEITTMRARGIRYQPVEGGAAAAPAPAAPPALPPTMPTIPGIPTIPTLGTGALPTLPPAMPTIPGIPTIPTIPILQ